MTKPKTSPWYLRIGPGLITACVVIGPGSIMTSTKVGATYGYDMNWIVVVAVIFMLIYMMLGAKLGVSTDETPGTLVTQRAGRWLAVLIGLGVFLISALFQFGNNMGVDAAFKVYFNFDYIIIVFNALSLAFLFGFRNLYKALERLMSVFVAVMLLCFAANLVIARPDWLALLLGFLPITYGEAVQLTQGTTPARFAEIDISLLGLVGTTFVISAAFLQPYLVQQKGWAKADVRQGIVDARVGATIMALITLMIISTSAAAFYQKDVALANVTDVANQLQPLLGRWAQAIFCLGLFSAAYSSFLVNSMIGGFILSDGLGLGGKPDALWPRIMTAVVLLVGMSVALLVIRTRFNPVGAIVTAQALTVIAAPLMAGVMLWLTNLKSIMGEDRNRPLVNVLAAGGFLLLLAIAWYTAAYKVAPQVQEWMPG